MHNVGLVVKATSRARGFSTMTPALSLTNQFGGVWLVCRSTQCWWVCTSSTVRAAYSAAESVGFRISGCVRDQPTCLVWSRPTNYSRLVGHHRRVQPLLPRCGCGLSMAVQEKDLIKFHRRASRPSTCWPASDRGHHQDRLQKHDGAPPKLTGSSPSAPVASPMPVHESYSGRAEQPHARAQTSRA